MNPSPDFLNAANIQRFRDWEPLAGYFPHYDERCVEWPWALGRLWQHGGIPGSRMLDAGATLNHEPVLDLLPSHLALGLSICTLAPEPNCFWKRGISYDFADLRELPYRDGYFDVVTCLSVLEHVGMDNTIYGGTKEHNVAGWKSAVADLWRVLAPGGTLLLTVPFGQYEDAGWFQQFDRHLFDSLVSRCYSRVSDGRWFYRLAPDGWRSSGPSGCADARYDHAGKRANAIACCALTKSPLHA